MDFRSRDEIEEQLDKTVDAVDGGSTQWPGMTYEQGVENALMWVTRQRDDKPMED